MMEIQLYWLCVHYWGGERLHAGVDFHGVWRGTRTMSRVGSTKLDFTTVFFISSVQNRFDDHVNIMIEVIQVSRTASHVVIKL